MSQSDAIVESRTPSARNTWRTAFARVAASVETSSPPGAAPFKGTAWRE
ncbi:hypothetical protein [Burkholderia sp. Nafp2/4-1b]|nr:hypothetical protein [Burkholderia sp. Nafp2/4-1b]